MKKLLLFALCMFSVPAMAMNEVADMLRRCEGVNVTNSDNYILRCRPDKKIKAVIADGIEQFFVADNGGDTRGAFLDSIPDNDDYIYVNVASNLSDSRYQNQTCYRFIREKDTKRDGFYAVQVCEYERADYYL